MTATYFEEECTEGMEIYGGLMAAPPMTCFPDDQETGTYKMITCGERQDQIMIFTYSDSSCTMRIDDDDDSERKTNMDCMMDPDTHTFMEQEVSCPDCNNANTDKLN